MTKYKQLKELPFSEVAHYIDGKLCGSFDMVDWGYGEEVDEFEILGNFYEDKNLL